MKNNVESNKKYEIVEEEKYIIDDIYDDNFAINFDTIKVKVKKEIDFDDDCLPF